MAAMAGLRATLQPARAECPAARSTPRRRTRTRLPRRPVRRQRSRPTTRRRGGVAATGSPDVQRAIAGALHHPPQPADVADAVCTELSAQTVDDVFDDVSLDLFIPTINPVIELVS